MKKPLIIVESPTKIKTLKKFLGGDYLFESSVGHIIDLPAKSFGIDLEKNFEPSYIILPDKKGVVEKLKAAAKKASVVYLCPDPDREGEAIAWHIASILPKSTPSKRVTFSSITKKEVSDALDRPRDLDMNMVHAQQARRLLDRIVGYKISPILSRRIHRKVSGSLSAGRVQSVALKLVVDREKAIDTFTPVEYWTIRSRLNNQQDTFEGYLFSIDGLKITKEKEDKTICISDKNTAEKIVSELEKSSYEILSVSLKEKKRHPVPPFITSTLQQEASRHYGFNSVKTMSIAQSLYEGVEMGESGSIGLITYMRTDSVRVVPEVIQEARHFIEKNFGNKFLPEKPNAYATKKSAQDAHEAIRPSGLQYSPESIKKYLTREQHQLYDLIWKRFLASQMASAVYDTVSCDIAAGSRFILRTTGSHLKFKGFLALYEEKIDEDKDEKAGQLLPSLKEGQKLFLEKVSAEQSFTKPPPRYTEALLIKELEKSGVGRPSTYASIMNKIQSRDYTVREKGRLKPTELGKVIAQMLETNFKQIMDINFTAKMEDDLELIADNEKDWKKLLQEFCDQFLPTVEQAEKEAFVPKVLTDEVCPKCQNKLMKIWAKSKYFYGCSDYPKCDFSAPLEQLSLDREDYDPEFDWEQSCPKCGEKMTVRVGRFGPFLGCTKYPSCNGIINIPKKGEDLPKEEDLPACPAIGCDGKIVAKRSRYGKIFFSCSSFPDCNVIVNELEELETKYRDYPKTPYVKKAKEKKKGSQKGKKTTRSQPAYEVSEELADVIGKGPFSRPEITQKIWVYIKEHALQDPKNKRSILPDEKLEKVFRQKEPVDMFQMAKLIGVHIRK